MDWENDCLEDGRVLMAVLKAAVDEGPLPPFVAKVQWERLYALAHFHRVANLAWFAMEKAAIPLPEALAKRWKEERDQAIVREIRFDVEREKLYGRFDAQGIAYLPLKGIVLKKLYPRPGMRWMSDHDILYQGTQQAAVVAVMSALGYETISLEGNHDVFHKAPIFNFEMHKALFPESSPFAAYWADPWERLVHPHGGDGYAMTERDFYLYFLMHFKKHLDGGGSGIRGLVDLYLLRQRPVDWDQMEAVLEALGLRHWHQDLVSLLDDVMAGRPLNAQSKGLFSYILTSGTYGTVENRIRNTLIQGDAAQPFSIPQKCLYVFHRLFPDYGFMCLWYPPLKEHPLLMPLAYARRLARGILKIKRSFYEFLVTMGL
ncbi:nucleotidyltransferase domain-containing protein [Eubacterium barkeri]|uniref:Uncharacterized nucleotidyltransferase n=1 Tax=Eubacterium barkeri TaxID=1528 RepID=A0A1H3HJF0_EUBBA|nr:nucleotidyltransferase family protein [Eubacterium barkeri]SDY15676.1 Uncharacterised nucleotidyltransferase [Eubacterium barkeri]